MKVWSISSSGEAYEDWKLDRQGYGRLHTLRTFVGDLPVVPHRPDGCG